MRPNDKPLFDVDSLNNLLNTKEIRKKNTEEAVLFHLHSSAEEKNIFYTGYSLRPRNGATLEGITAMHPPFPINKSRKFSHVTKLAFNCIVEVEEGNENDASDEPHHFPLGTRKIIFAPLAIFSTPFGWVSWPCTEEEDTDSFFAHLVCLLSEWSCNTMLLSLLKAHKSKRHLTDGLELLKWFSSQLAAWLMPLSYTISGGELETPLVFYHFGFHTNEPNRFVLELEGDYRVEFNIASMSLVMQSKTAFPIRSLSSFTVKEKYLNEQLTHLFSLFHFALPKAGRDGEFALKLKDLIIKLAEVPTQRLVEFLENKGEYAPKPEQASNMKGQVKLDGYENAFFNYQGVWYIFYKKIRIIPSSSSKDLAGLRIIWYLLSNPEESFTEKELKEVHELSYNTHKKVFTDADRYAYMDEIISLRNEARLVTDPKEKYLKWFTIQKKSEILRRIGDAKDGFGKNHVRLAEIEMAKIIELMHVNGAYDPVFLKNYENFIIESLSEESKHVRDEPTAMKNIKYAYKVLLKEEKQKDNKQGKVDELRIELVKHLFESIIRNSISKKVSYKSRMKWITVPIEI